MPAVGVDFSQSSLDSAPSDRESAEGGTIERERVWLDTDPGMGVPGSDIDDGLAILLLLASPELALEGISLTFGNVSLAEAATSCERVLRAADCPVPFHLGADGADALHRPTLAAEALVTTVRSTSTTCTA